jgi:hypothetical protein
MSEKKRAGGRPPKTPEDRKATNLTIRSRRDLRDQLERAAMANGRSISLEADARLETSLKDDVIAGDLAVLHALIRSYLQLLGIRRTDPLWAFDLRDPEVADALRIGLDLLVTATCSGPLSKERTKEFWIAAMKTRRASGATTAQIATEAFNVLSMSNLAAPVDPLDVEEWVRAVDAEKEREP